MEEGVGLEGLPIQLRRIVQRAVGLLGNSYAPYSRVHVASALITPSGKVFEGVNVENASYGLTICAERAAVASMVTAGERRVKAIAVVSNTAEPLPPCGACRQVLAEFGGEDLVIVSFSVKTRRWRVWKLSELLPYAFTSSHIAEHG